MKYSLPRIAFEITSVCNLKCKYCYNIWKAPEAEEFKHFNSYSQALKTLKHLFKVADVQHVTFTGGEPFLAERFPEIVLFTRLKNKSVSIISNGTMAKPEDYKTMSDLGVSLIEIPILADNATQHDTLTGIKGSWQKVVDSVKSIVPLKMQLVAVIVITKINYADIDKTLQFIHNQGIRRVMLNRFNIGGAGIVHQDELNLTHRELNLAYQKASDAGKNLGLSLSSNVCTPICVVNPQHFPNIRFSSCSPKVEKRPLTIDILGNLRFCNHSPSILGNIFTDSLEKMLHSEKAQLWSNLVPEYCTNCELYSKCMAGCRAASEQLRLSLNHVDPLVLYKST